jgi:uncharacterized protein (TIGR02996 family)
MSADEWAFIRACVDKPVDVAHRLIYADWLEERGLIKRANKQREIAAVIGRAVEMWKLYPHFTSGVFGVIVNRKGIRKLFRLKRDGELRWYPPGVQPTLYFSRIIGYRLK